MICSTLRTSQHTQIEFDHLLQVLANDDEHKQLTIVWYEPTPRSRERGNTFDLFTFREETVLVPRRNQQRGAAAYFDSHFAQP